MPKCQQFLLPFLTALLFFFVLNPDLYGRVFNVPQEIRTIQGAIDQSRDLDTVLVRPGRYRENIVFGGREILLTSLIMLDGDEDYIESTIIDGSGESVCLAFTEAEGRDLIVRGFTITNGWQNFGGGIDCQDDSSPTLLDLLVTGNEAVQIGGGIYCTWSSTPIIRNCIVENNIAQDGAGIGLAHECHPTITNVIIRNNEASNNGGGVFAGHGDGEGTFENVTISNNSAGYGGGAYFEWTQNVIFENVVFDGNTAIDAGSGVFSNRGDFSLNLCKISDSEGDAIDAIQAIMDIELCEIIDNDGIAISTEESVINLTNTQLSGNLSGIIAGYTELNMHMCEITECDSLAISVFDSSVVVIDSSDIINNGGAGLVVDSSIVAITVTNINDNLLGIFASDSDLSLMRCEIAGSDSFGISLMDSSIVQIDSSLIVSNQGNGVVADSSFIVLMSTIIEDNEIGLSGNNVNISLLKCDVIENNDIGISIRDTSTVRIDSCIINNNDEAGLNVQNSTITVHRAEFNENDYGIILEHSDLVMSQVSMSRNFNGGFVAFNGCDIKLNFCKVEENRYRAGIHIDGSTFIANQCLVRGNYAEWGGGIRLISCNAGIYNTYFTENSADDWAGGLYSTDSKVSLINSTFYQNSAGGFGGAIYGTNASQLEMVNCILWDNPNQAIVVDRQGQENIDTLISAYNCIEGGINSVGGDGEIVWLDGNIDSDPLFATIDSSGHSFLPDSPCIDAGTAFFVYGGDTLVDIAEDQYLDDAPDMGAFERDHTGIDDDADEIPEIYTLISTYPNPFNSSLTTIINLKAPSFTRLAIFDLQGREVAVLNDKPLPAGKSSFIWDARGYSQGIYFVQLETLDFEMHKKVVYLK